MKSKNENVDIFFVVVSHWKSNLFPFKICVAMPHRLMCANNANEFGNSFHTFHDVRTYIYRNNTVCEEETTQII